MNLRTTQILVLFSPLRDASFDDVVHAMIVAANVGNDRGLMTHTLTHAHTYTYAHALTHTCTRRRTHTHAHMSTLPAREQVFV